MSDGRFYVYVYIDPRNNEEFYYGKGTGSRKLAHLSQEGDNEKINRIKNIKKEGLNISTKDGILFITKTKYF